MPGIKISSKRLEKEVKQQIAENLTTDLNRFLQVSTISVVFDEYEIIYVNGKESINNHITISVEGPVTDNEKISEICAAFYNSVQRVINQPESKISFVYHANNRDHVGSNGVIHSMRK